jgi:hypothetical protein
VADTAIGPGQIGQGFTIDGDEDAILVGGKANVVDAGLLHSRNCLWRQVEHIGWDVERLGQIALIEVGNRPGAIRVIGNGKVNNRRCANGSQKIFLSLNGFRGVVAWGGQPSAGQFHLLPMGSGG